jgi:hypothetical protein
VSLKILKPTQGDAMESDGNAPNPTDDGVNGTQQAGNLEDFGESATPPLSGQFIERALVGLAAARPGKFGGDLGAPIFVAMVNHLTHEKEQAKAFASEAQSRLDRTSDELNTLKVKVVRLEERLKSSQNTGRIKQVCAFLSPIFYSVAIDLSENNAKTAAVVAIAATALLFVNFFGFRDKSE